MQNKMVGFSWLSTEGHAKAGFLMQAECIASRQEVQELALVKVTPAYATVE